jgi:hypothetical protein
VASGLNAASKAIDRVEVVPWSMAMTTVGNGFSPKLAAG